MKIERIKINNIPSMVWGEKAIQQKMSYKK